MPPLFIRAVCMLLVPVLLSDPALAAVFHSRQPVYRAVVFADPVFHVQAIPPLPLFVPPHDVRVAYEVRKSGPGTPFCSTCTEDDDIKTWLNNIGRLIQEVFFKAPVRVVPTPTEMRALHTLIGSIVDESLPNDVRAAAFEVLMNFQLNETMVQRLCDALHHMTTRWLVHDILRFVTGLQTASAYVHQTLTTLAVSATRPAWLRADALEFLSDIGRSAVIDVDRIRDVFINRDDDGDIRALAAAVLFPYPERDQDIPHFYAALSDPHPVIRMAAGMGFHFRRMNEIAAQLTAEQLLGPLVPVTMPPRANKPKVAMVVMDTFSDAKGVFDHGDYMREHLEELRSQLRIPSSVRMYPAKILPDQRTLTGIDIDPALNELEDLVAENPDTLFVVNFSLIGHDRPMVHGFMDPARIQKLGEAGVVFVASAGNLENIPGSFEGLRVRFPRAANLIVVAGADRGRRAAYTWYGPDVTIAADPAPKPEGTSHAAVIVTAVLAKTLTDHPEFSAADAIQHIRERAVPLSDELFAKGWLGAGQVRLEDYLPRLLQAGDRVRDSAGNIYTVAKIMGGGRVSLEHEGKFNLIMKQSMLRRVESLAAVPILGLSRESQGIFQQASDLAAGLFQSVPATLIMAAGVVLAAVLIHIGIRFVRWLCGWVVDIFEIETAWQKAYWRNPSPNARSLAHAKIAVGKAQTVWGPGITPPESARVAIAAAQGQWARWKKYGVLNDALAGVRIVVVKDVDILDLLDYFEKTYKGSYWDPYDRTIYVAEGFWDNLTDHPGLYLPDWLTQTLYQVVHPNGTHRQARRFARAIRFYTLDYDYALHSLAYAVHEKRREEEDKLIAARRPPPDRVVEPQDIDEAAFQVLIKRELRSSVFVPGGPVSRSLPAAGPWTRFRRRADSIIVIIARLLRLPKSWTLGYMLWSIAASVRADMNYKAGKSKADERALQKALGDTGAERVSKLQELAETGNAEDHLTIVIDAIRSDPEARSRLAAVQAVVPLLRRADSELAALVLPDILQGLYSLSRKDPHNWVRDAATRAIRELEELFPPDRKDPPGGASSSDLSPFPMGGPHTPPGNIKRIRAAA